MAYSNLYENLKKNADAVGEKKDCSVKALAIATDTPYEVAHEALRLAGRKHNTGSSAQVLAKALKNVGASSPTLLFMRYNNRQAEEETTRKLDIADRIDYDGEVIAVFRKKGLTPNNIAKYLDPKKRYLVHVRKHVFAVVNGRVHDWSERRKFRIELIQEVIV